MSHRIVNGFVTDLFIDVISMKYLLVILLVGCTQTPIVVPVPSNQKEANCIVKVGDRIFLTICKENKT